MSYAFEGNFNDGSGKGNNGMALVAAVVATDPARGRVLSLDGLSGVAVTFVAVSDEVTIAAWANLDDLHKPF